MKRTLSSRDRQRRQLLPQATAYSCSLATQETTSRKIVYLNGSIKELNLGTDLRVPRLAGTGQVFTILAYDTSRGEYTLTLLSIDGEPLTSKGLGRTGVFGFGPGDGYLTFTSLGGGYLNVSIIDEEGLHPVYSRPQPPISVGAILPAWQGVMLLGNRDPNVRWFVNIYASSKGMWYVSDVFNPINSWVVEDRLYWVFNGGIVSLGENSTKFYPWRSYYGTVWWLGDKALAASGDYVYVNGSKMVKIRYDVFTPPDRVVSEDVLIDYVNTCGGDRGVVVGLGPGMPAYAIKGSEAVCLGLAGDFLQSVNVSTGNYGLAGVWGVGDLTVAIFANFFEPYSHLLVIASREGIKITNLTQLIIDNTLRYFDLVNITRIFVSADAAALSPDGSRLAVKLKIMASIKLIRTYEEAVFLRDTLIVDSQGNCYLISSLLDRERLEVDYPIGWVTPERLIAGNPPVLLDFSGSTPEIVAYLGNTYIHPFSILIPHHGGILAAAQYEQDGKKYSLPLILTGHGAKILIPTTIFVPVKGFAELVPMGKHYAVITWEYQHPSIISRVYTVITGIEDLAPARILIRPDGDLVLDCYSSCEAVLTSAGGRMQVLHSGESVTLTPGAEYILRLGNEVTKIEVPPLTQGLEPPTEEAEESLEYMIVEGLQYCPSAIWIRFGQRLEVYDAGVHILTIPYPDTRVLRDVVNGKNCLQLEPGTHYLTLVYRDTAGRVARVTNVNITVAPATGTLKPISLNTGTTTITTTTTAATTASGTTASVPPLCGWSCLQLILLVIVIILIILSLKKRRRSRKGISEEKSPSFPYDEYSERYGTHESDDNDVYDGRAPYLRRGKCCLSSRVFM